MQEKYRQTIRNVNVFPQKELGDLYTRPVDTLSSTEFTFTRFLVPALMNYNGWALFMDCDCVLLEDIENLFSQTDDRYAVMCAKHDYTPKATTKMNGAVQHQYPRKIGQVLYCLIVRTQKIKH